MSCALGVRFMNFLRRMNIIGERVTGLFVGSACDCVLRAVDLAEKYSNSADKECWCRSNFDHAVTMCQQCLCSAITSSDTCHVILFLADVECNWLILNRRNVTKYIGERSL
jgi:hypothetical protein